MPVRIYLNEELDKVPWHEIEDGARQKLFYAPLFGASTQIYIKNSAHRLGLAKIGQKILPLSYQNRQPRPSASESCYLLSFPAQYFDYAQEEVRKQSKYSPLQKWAAEFLVKVFKKISVGLGMERVVFVNNQLLSTNLYPQLSDTETAALVRVLKEKFPQAALVFRTLNEETNQTLEKRLHLEKALKITCRQIYILPQTCRRKRAFVRDQKLWQKNTRFEWVEKKTFTPSERKQILRFYTDLYIKKHSVFNPIYSEEMLINSAKSGLLRYYLLIEKETKALKAVQAVAIKNGEITTPFIGYDPEEPQKTGLYRFMNLQLMTLAQHEKLRLNMSSGAAQFKTQRGGLPAFDNHFVICDHLPIRRKIIWTLLQKISETIVRPTMLKMKL